MWVQRPGAMKPEWGKVRGCRQKGATVMYYVRGSSVPCGARDWAGDVEHRCRLLELGGQCVL